MSTDVLGELREIRKAIEALSEQMRLRTAEPHAYTLKGAAKALSVGLTKLREMVAGGKLHTVKLGKRTMVPRSEVERLATPPPAPTKARRLPKRTQAEALSPEDLRAWRREEKKRLTR